MMRDARSPAIGTARSSKENGSLALAPLKSSDECLAILNDTPSQAELERCLRSIDSLDFNIHKPGPQQSLILTTLITRTLPDFYDASTNDAKFRQRLLRTVASVGGLGALVARLNSLWRDAKHKPSDHGAATLLEILSTVLQSRGCPASIWSQLCQLSVNPTQKQLLWKEYVSLTAGGKITNTAAQYTKEELGAAAWLADGSSFIDWLSVGAGELFWNVQMKESVPSVVEEAVPQLISRALSFGYNERLVSGIVDSLCFSKPPAGSPPSSAQPSGDSIMSQNGTRSITILADFLTSLRTHDQRRFVEAFLVLASKVYLDQQSISLGQSSSHKAIGAFIALLERLSSGNEGVRDLLCTWLTSSHLSTSTSTPVLRAVIAVIAADQDKLEETLARLWEQWANQLFIRHAPTSQQNTLSQALLVTAGYVYRTAPMYVFTLARSSVHTHGLSNRLESTSPRARWLGMTVGSAISELIDKSGQRLTFDTEDMKTEDAIRYRSLTQVDDHAGDIQDLRRPTHQQSTAVVQTAKPSKASKSSDGLLKASKMSNSIAKNDSLEPIGVSIPASLRIVELDDTDDLIPYAKPDSDPEDNNTDATLVNRDKPKPPIYIRDLIRYLLDSQDIERRTLALQTAPGLIRRKTSHGKEVTDHIEELATAVAGLNDGDTFDLDDEEFARLRHKSLQAVLVANAKKMGPWFAKAIFNVTADYSIAQRMGLLIAMGLGGRELAGFEHSDEDEAKDMFPSKRLKGKMHNIWAGEIETRTHKKNKKLKPMGRSGLLVDSGNALSPNAMDRLTTDLERTMLEPLALDAADKLSGPDVLKVRKFSSRMDVERRKTKPKANELSKLVAEAFFFPLTGHLSTGVQTRKTGSSASFNKFLLPTYLRTLSLLLHSAGPSTPAFATLTTEFWGLLLSLRSIAANDAPTLEALLFSLLTILELNAERQEDTVRDHAKELIETQEWARMILENAPSGGSEEEDKVKMLAAGVVVRCSEVVQKYQRRLLGDMVDI